MLMPVVTDVCLKPDSIRVPALIISAIEAELECVGADPCRSDVIMSEQPTQRGAELEGPDSQGRLWVREVSDNADTPGQPCSSWTRTLEIGIVRCHHTTGAGGSGLPDPSWYALESRRAYVDKEAVAAAVSTMKHPRVTLTGWRPYGPSSYAIGGIWTVTYQHWR